MVYVINTLGKPCLLEEKRRKSAWCGLADLGALILIVVQCSVKVGFNTTPPLRPLHVCPSDCAIVEEVLIISRNC
jgi:hypothetical protein